MDKPTWDDTQEVAPKWDDTSEPSQKKKEERDDILGIPVSTVEGVLDALPFAGTLFGGALGTAGAPGVGTVVGAGLGAATGEAVANSIRSGLDLESAPQTSREVWEEPAKEGVVGLTAEAGGQVLSKVPGLIKKVPDVVKRGTKMIKGEPTPSVEVISPNQSFKDIGFEQTLKSNADDIQQSTQRIAQSNATPGMVTSNQNIQNVENILAQSPTVAGEKVRKAYKPITEGLEKSADDLAGSPNMTSFEAGEQVKQGIKSKISEKVKPLSSQFEQIRTSSKYIRPNKDSLNRSADRLLKQDLAEFVDLPQGQAIKKYAEMIRGAKSLDSLKQLRSSVGDEISAAINSGNGQMAMALGKVKSSIQRLERREIIKAAIDAMPTKAQGQKAAKELIGDLKEVNKGWRSLMSELESIAKAGGIKKIHSPKHLAKLIEDMPSEKLAERFFNTKNYSGLRDVKKFLPDEFEILRQHKLGQIAERSLTKGQPDPFKLVRNLKKVGKESRELLFGKDGEKILSDMETVINSLPRKVGSSDTPRGISWFASVLKPSNYSREAESAMNYMRLTGRISSKKVGQKTSQIVPRAASYAVVSSMSKDDKRRGADKWAANGLKKVQSASDGKFSNISEKDFKDSPKLKKLMIRASDLSPNSKAMANILKQIEKEFGGKN
jgi:predicted transcriptional regulator